MAWSGPGFSRSRATSTRASCSPVLVVASTHGNKETDCVVDGKKVIVGVNAYIPVK